MEAEKTDIETIKTKRMLNDEEFFKHIFKKTEKIACAVFYIINNDLNKKDNNIVIHDLEKSALEVLNVALQTLKATEGTLPQLLNELTHALLTLESRLRISFASGFLDTQVLNVFIHEMNTVHRTLRRYMSSSTPAGGPTQAIATQNARQSLVSKERVPERSSSHSSLSRRDQIVMFLRDNTEASIKDLASVIKDCSEKTIQRELTSMIKDNLVSREGERRWSKYRLV